MTTSKQDSDQQWLEEIGFSFREGGAHSAHIIVLGELFAVVDASAPIDAYKQAILEGIYLRKRFEKNRLLTFLHLSDLYALDTQVALFCTLRALWDRDESALPMLALFCALARDAVLRQTIPFILSLDYKTLETLTYTYLGDWISCQKRDWGEGIDGAEETIIAAEQLKKRLELILHGEAPYDIFVRWKPLEEQPIGWNPGLNDGVRLNIRPFLTVTGKKGTGMLRDKPNNKWTKDRGKDVESAPWYHVLMATESTIIT